MKLLWLLTTLVCLAACNSNRNEPAQEQHPAADTRSATGSSNTNSWPGTYKGTTPCADCPGIETTLTLNADSTFMLHLVYLETPSQSPIVAKGRFRWTNGTNTVILDGLLNQPNQYSVGQNMLMQMDMTGQPITGPNAARYMLMKQSLQSVTITKE